MMLNTKYKGPPRRPASSSSTPTTSKQGPSGAVPPPLFPEAPTTTILNSAVSTPSRPATASTSRAAATTTTTPRTAPQHRYAASTKSSSSAARARELSGRDSHLSTFSSRPSSSRGGLPLTPTPPPQTKIHRKANSLQQTTPPHNLSSNLNADYFNDIVDHRSVGGGGRSAGHHPPSSLTPSTNHQIHDVNQREESSCLFDLHPSVQPPHPTNRGEMGESTNGGDGVVGFVRGTEFSLGGIPHTQSMSCATNNTSYYDGSDSTTTKHNNISNANANHHDDGSAAGIVGGGEVVRSRNGSSKSVGGFNISMTGRNSLDAGIDFQRDVRVAMSNVAKTSDNNNNTQSGGDNKRRNSSIVSIRNLDVAPITIANSNTATTTTTVNHPTTATTVFSPQYGTTSPGSPSWGTSSIRGRHVEGLSPSGLPPSLFDLQDPSISDATPPPEVKTDRQRSRWESLRRRVQQSNSSTKAWDYAIYGYYYLNDDFREGGGGSPGDQEGEGMTPTTGSIIDNHNNVGSGDVVAAAAGSSVQTQPLGGSTAGFCGGDSTTTTTPYQSALFRSYLSDDGFGSMARLKYSTRSSGKLLHTKSTTDDVAGSRGGGLGMGDDGPTVSDIFKSVGASNNNNDDNDEGRYADVCRVSQADKSPHKSTSSRRPSALHVVCSSPSPLVHLSSSFSRLSNRSPLHDKEKADIRKVHATRTQIEEAQVELSQRVAMLRKERAAERRTLSLQGSSSFNVQPPPGKPQQPAKRKGPTSSSSYPSITTGTGTTRTGSPAATVAAAATITSPNSPFLSPRQRREKQSQIRNARERLKRAAVSVRPSSPAPLGIRHPSSDRHTYNRLTVQARLKRDKWWEVKAGYQIKLTEMDDLMVGRAAVRIQRWLRVDLPTRRQRRLDNAARHEERVHSYECRQRYLRAQRKWRWAFGELQKLWRTPWYKGGVQRVQAAGRRLLSQTRLIRQLTATSNTTSPLTTTLNSFSFSSPIAHHHPPTIRSIAHLMPGVDSVRSRTACIISLLRDVRDTERRVVLERERQQSAILTVQRWWRGVSAQSLSYGYFISEERRYHAGRYNTWLRGGAGIDCGLLRNAAAAVATTTTTTTPIPTHATSSDRSSRNIMSKRHAVEAYKYQRQYEVFAENALQEAYLSCSGAPTTTSSSPLPILTFLLHNTEEQHGLKNPHQRSPSSSPSNIIALFESHQARVWQFICANGDKWGVKRLLEESVYAPLPIHVNAGAFVKSRRQHNARVIQNTLFRDHYCYRRCARKPLKVFLRGRVDMAVLRIQRAWRRYLQYRQEYIEKWRAKNGLKFSSSVL